MIESAKQACLTKEIEDRRIAAESAKEAAREKEAEQDQAKKRKLEEELSSWQSKYDAVSEELRILEEKIKMQSKSVLDALSIADKTKNEASRKAGIKTAIEAQNNLEESRKLAEDAQKRLNALARKKPKK